MSKKKGSLQERRDETLDAWRYHVEDMRIKGADELFSEHERAIEWVSSLYAAKRSARSQAAQEDLGLEIAKAHERQGQHLDSLVDELAGPAVQASLHRIGYGQTVGQASLEALEMMRDAIDRGDAKSAAYLSSVFTLGVLSLYEADSTELLKKLGALDDREDGPKAALKAKEQRKLVVEEALLSVCDAYGGAPTVGKLDMWLGDYTDGEFSTGLQSCPKIAASKDEGRSKNKHRIHFFLRLDPDPDSDLKDYFLTLGSYKKDYLPGLKEKWREKP